jgi:hypothetical protein
MTRARRISGTLFERWADKVLIDDGCWEWQAGRQSKGYGTMGHDGYAHRLAYSMIIGEIPDGLCVCHHCDNPNCVRPSHLWVGTKADNSRDMVAKGRQHTPSGTDNPNAKLTETDVLDILQSIGKESTRAIGRRLGVSHQVVRAIRDERAWKQVPR